MTRQLRDYYRAYPPRHDAPQAQAYAPSPDAARLDPWHGYNPHGGPGNGY